MRDEDVDERQNEDEDEGEDVLECELCGLEHEARDCDTTYCATCRENVENCDCENTIEISAEEFLALEKKPIGEQ